MVATAVNHSQSQLPWRLIYLTVGFVSLSIGTFIAWNNPATGYEISIYTHSPVLYWVGVAIAFIAAAGVTVSNPGDAKAGIAMVLGGLAALTIGGLPVIRGYRFYGLGDAMTHLGWSEELRTNLIGFFDLFYPAAHSVSVLLAEFAGLTTEQSLITFMVVMIALFILFVPLSAHAISNQSRVTIIAAFSGFMLLPFTTISTALHFHTYSIGVLFLPLVLYLLIKYLTSQSGQPTVLGLFNSWMIMLVAAGLVMLFIHPQVKFNVILLIGSLVFVQLVLIRRPNHVLGGLQPVILVFVVLSLAWLLWMMQFPEYFSRGNRILGAVRATLMGTAQPGETVTAQTTSARAIGASTAELFVKIFLVPLLYSVFAILAGIIVFLGRGGCEEHHTAPMVSYFAISGIVLVPFFLLHFAGDISHLFFRHVGFALAMVTIIGAIGFHLGANLIWSGRVRLTAKTIVVAMLAVMLLLSLLIAFPSPYIYNQSHHATDQDMSGHATAFAVSDPTIPYSGIRNWPHRYADALTIEFNNPTVAGIDGDELAEPTTARASAYYLPISLVDVEREVIAYKELRYSAATFENLDSRHGVDRVMDNGEFSLYHVRTD